MSNNFNSSDLIQKLGFYFDNGKNVLLTGHKGVGKTAIIVEVFKAKTKNWLYFSGSTMDPFVDFIGVPKEKTLPDGSSALEFIRPTYMNEDVEAIFIDEYNRSAKKIRNAVMELIQFKSLNGKKFPNLKVVWAGVNPFNPDDDENEIYDVEPIDPAQQDRFQIQIEVPYAVDEQYFATKYGKMWAEGAVEWWNELPEKIKKSVSPRRMDYALEVYTIGGEVSDVLPIQSNPSKLIASLQVGGIEKVVIDIFKRRDRDAAVKLLSEENNYQSLSGFIVQNREWANFFWPLLDEERQLSLFFSNTILQNLIFKDPIAFKNTLEAAAENSLCAPDILAKVKHLLNQMKGISLDTFSDGSNPFGQTWGVSGVVQAPTTFMTGMMPSSSGSYIAPPPPIKPYFKPTITPHSKDLIVEKTIFDKNDESDEDKKGVSGFFQKYFGPNPEESKHE